MLWVSDSLKNNSLIWGCASLWRALYITFTVSKSISCSIQLNSISIFLQTVAHSAELFCKGPSIYEAKAKILQKLRIFKKSKLKSVYN